MRVGDAASVMDPDLVARPEDDCVCVASAVADALMLGVCDSGSEIEVLSVSDSDKLAVCVCEADVLSDID
jgi:hypothetical protein